MEKRAYFCNVKQKIHVVRTLFLTFFLAFTLASQQVLAQDASRMDSVEIGFVTCAPHEEVYSLYGHAALRFHDLHTGEDLMFNYGIFHPDSKLFMWHFLQGHTDYELGVAPTNAFLKYYEKWGSQVTEQVLNLTNEEKALIINALRVNYLPQNRIYRYNIFFDNCSTRPRDIVVANVKGRVEYAPREGFSPSFREMVRDCTFGHPWATFGNDILLGVRADMPTTQSEQHFLPVNLRHDFDRAVVVRQGEREPLVSERRELVSPGIQMVEQGFPLSPFACSLILLALSMMIFTFEQMKKTIVRWFDIFMMLLTGLAGCILALMLFSEHPTTSTNLQVLLLNPLPLLFLWPVARGRKTWFFHLQLVLTLLFLAGGLWQSYAEGMYVVAVCVLLRIARHLSRRITKESNKLPQQKLNDKLLRTWTNKFVKR